MHRAGGGMAGFGALLRQCPLLLPQNREGTAYEGFVTAQGKDFHIRILLPMDFELKNTRIECSWHLKKILHGYRHILKQRLHSCPDLVSFMVELKTILDFKRVYSGNCKPTEKLKSQEVLSVESSSLQLFFGIPAIVQMVKKAYNHTKDYTEIALKNTQDLHIPRPPEYYSCLIREIEILGWNKVAYVDTGLTTIKLKAEDSCGRQHLITLKLNAKYPTEPPDCLVDFPVQFSISWMPQNSLMDIYNQFLAALESLKEFWDTMDEIDGKTWVLEPENPTRSATTRRIAIGNNVSVNIEVDPRHPNMLPSVIFLEQIMVRQQTHTPFVCLLDTGLWDPEISLLQNLKDLLEIDFPSCAVLEKSDFAKDCGICYAYRLNGTTPDQVCDDSRCGQPFHQACLYEWLQGLPSSRQSFNVIFGECPYCNKPLTLKYSMKKL